jgi:hypothetical protein
MQGSITAYNIFGDFILTKQLHNLSAVELIGGLVNFNTSHGTATGSKETGERHRGKKK